MNRETGKDRHPMGAGLFGGAGGASPGVEKRAGMCYNTGWRVAEPPTGAGAAPGIHEGSPHRKKQICRSRKNHGSTKIQRKNEIPRSRKSSGIQAGGAPVGAT